MSADRLQDTIDDIPLPRRSVSPRLFAGRVDVAGLSHQGRVRKNNEDNFLIVQFGRFLRPLASSFPISEIPGLFERTGHGFLVADGVGGSNAGEVASQLAITLFVQEVLGTPDWILGQEDDDLDRILARSIERFQAVNEGVMGQARSSPEREGMGTTLSMAVSFGEDLLLAHVGDSPILLHTHGKLLRLTEDHTHGRLWSGVDAKRAARLRHILTHAIGLPTGSEPDVSRRMIADGDCLLLCTDGLTDMVDDDAIAAELGRPSSAADICQELVGLALNGGGKDNVTVVVARYQLNGETTPDESQPAATRSFVSS